jgi:hypothetical protein
VVNKVAAHYATFALLFFSVVCKVIYFTINTHIQKFPHTSIVMSEEAAWELKEKNINVHVRISA